MLCCCCATSYYEERFFITHALSCAATGTPGSHRWEVPKMEEMRTWFTPRIFVVAVWLLANSACFLLAAPVGSQFDSLVVEGARPRVHGTKHVAQPTFLETFSSASVGAGPDDDNEAEISALFVKIKTKSGACQANGTQWLDYHFLKGKFKTAQVELGDDTVGIGFFTKNILNLSSPQLTNHSKIEVKKRSTTRCKSVLMWNFPEVVAPPVVRQRFRIDFAMDMGTIENGTKKYNELVYSTGFHYRLAIKRIMVEFVLPKAYKKSRIKIFGPDLVNETGGVYDEKTGTVKFERDTYLAPMNRYTVRVWFPTEKHTDGCFACARVGDWIMFLVLAPFVFCFLVPCVLLYLARDAQQPGGGNAGRSANGGARYHPVAMEEPGQ